MESVLRCSLSSQSRVRSASCRTRFFSGSRRCTMLLASLIVLSNIGIASAQTSFRVLKPCDSEYYFDTSGLQCLECPEGEVVSADGMSCECEAGSIRQPITDDPSPQDGYTTCLSCADLGMATTLDKTACIKCDNSTALTNFTSPTTFDKGTGDCTCGDFGFLVERDEVGLLLAEGKVCRRCPTVDLGHPFDTFRDPTDPSSCTQCPEVEGTVGGQHYMVYNAAQQRCECPPGLPAGTDCVNEGDMEAWLEDRYKVNLNDNARSQMTVYPEEGVNVNVDSLLMLESVVPLAWRCARYANRTACNGLANLCVLHQYDQDAVPCKLYLKMQDERDSVQYHDNEMKPEVGWSFSLPWLYYDGQASVYEQKVDVEMKVSFEQQGYASSTVSDLVFVLSMYSLEGEWLGFHNFTSQFQLCGGAGGSNMDAWRRFGTNFRSRCSVAMADLQRQVAATGLDTATVTFFDLYLQDLQGQFNAAWPARLYPVPVLNLNYRGSGMLVNQARGGVEGANDVLVRRFFFYDGLSTKETAAGPPTAHRFASSVKLEVNINPDAKSRIFPPLLTLAYSEPLLPSGPYSVSVADLGASFQVLYLMDMSGFWETWTILMVVALVVAFLWWAVRMYNYVTRRQDGNLDYDVMVRGVAEGASTVGMSMFLLCFGVASYFFVFYKAQSEVFLMLPEDAKMSEFTGCAMIAVIGHAVGLAHLIHRQCSVDIFFLDWEKSRVGLGTGGGREEAPVSVWRTLFVANEWNELQTERLTSVELTLSIVLAALYGLRLQGLGKFTPNSEDLSDSFYDDTSMVLRFAIACFLMLFAAVAQIAFKFVFYHRYVEHPLEQFVDLLTLANVSVFVLYDRFAGYYLHGRSLMAQADTTMVELNAQMHKEQEMQVAARGLVPGGDRPELAENQCFEIYITRELREQYESKLLRKIEEAALRARELNPNMLPTMQKPELPQERMVQAQVEIAATFRSFVNEVESNANQHVRERLFTDMLVQQPPDMFLTNHAVFYHDLFNQWGSTMFYGIEVELLVLDMLVFCMVDSACSNFAVAAFITYLVARTVKMYRHQYGEFNVSRKALIDTRFLI